MKPQFSASISKEGDWYVAQCLEVDVASQGKTEAEALENLREALELHFEAPRAKVAPRVEKIEADIDAA
jgi:predicted RNase H-like HicB family nuclease